MADEEEKNWQIQRFEKGADLDSWVKGMGWPKPAFDMDDVEKLVRLYLGTAGALSAAFAGSEGTRAQTAVVDVMTMFKNFVPKTQREFKNHMEAAIRAMNILQTAYEQLQDGSPEACAIALATLHQICKEQLESVSRNVNSCVEIQEKNDEALKIATSIKIDNVEEKNRLKSLVEDAKKRNAASEASRKEIEKSLERNQKLEQEAVKERKFDRRMELGFGLAKTVVHTAGNVVAGAFSCVTGPFGKVAASVGAALGGHGNQTKEEKGKKDKETNEDEAGRFVSAAASETASLYRELTEAEAAVESATLEVGRLEAKLDKAKAKLEASGTDSEKATLQQKVSELKSKLKQAQTALAIGTKKKSAMRQALEEQKAATDRIAQQFGARADAATEDIRALRQQVDKLEEQKRLILVSMAEDAAVINSTDAKVSDLEKTIRGLLFTESALGLAAAGFKEDERFWQDMAAYLSRMANADRLQVINQALSQRTPPVPSNMQLEELIKQEFNEPEAKLRVIKEIGLTKVGDFVDLDDSPEELATFKSAFRPLEWKKLERLRKGSKLDPKLQRMIEKDVMNAGQSWASLGQFAWIASDKMEEARLGSLRMIGTLPTSDQERKVLLEALPRIVNMLQAPPNEE